ncbi:MAG: hypothetical protein EOO38_32650 [Cytophagaceae bacterium]|nr:MAG: hypothetical protein EOO38_32650 [Cytophagaceae bacterium]
MLIAALISFAFRVISDFLTFVADYTRPRYEATRDTTQEYINNAGHKAEGYWFKSDEGIYFLAEKEVAGTSPWSKSALTLAPAGITSLGIWPNADSAKTLGISVAVTAAGLLSDVPAAAAAPAAPTTP